MYDILNIAKFIISKIKNEKYEYNIDDVQALIYECNACYMAAMNNSENSLKKRLINDKAYIGEKGPIYTIIQSLYLNNELETTLENIEYPKLEEKERLLLEFTIVDHFCRKSFSKNNLAFQVIQPYSLAIKIYSSKKEIKTELNEIEAVKYYKELIDGWDYLFEEFRERIKY